MTFYKNVSCLRKLRFVLERKSQNVILLLLTLVSVLLIFKTSNEPILPMFQGGFIEDVFQRFTLSNELIYDLSIGYIVSVIFYLIVVYIPEKKKQNDIKPYINSKCEEIIFYCYALLHEIISKSNNLYDYKTLTKEQLVEMCTVVNPKEHLYNFGEGVGIITQRNLGYKIFNDWTRISKEIEEIFRLLPFIDTGLIQRLNSIYTNFLRFTIRDLAEIGKLKNENLGAWSETFYKFYLESKDLRDYYVTYSGRTFENDPWK